MHPFASRSLLVSRTRRATTRRTTSSVHFRRVRRVSLKSACGCHMSRPGSALALNRTLSSLEQTFPSGLRPLPLSLLLLVCLWLATLIKLQYYHNLNPPVLFPTRPLGCRFGSAPAANFGFRRTRPSLARLLLACCCSIASTTKGLQCAANARQTHHPANAAARPPARRHVDRAPPRTPAPPARGRRLLVLQPREPPPPERERSDWRAYPSPRLALTPVLWSSCGRSLASSPQVG